MGEADTAVGVETRGATRRGKGAGSSWGEGSDPPIGAQAMAGAIPPPPSTLTLDSKMKGLYLPMLNEGGNLASELSKYGK